MDSVKNKFANGSFSMASLPYLLLTVAGVSFCFFLGFPFDNHNESFLWIPILNKVNFWDTLTSQVIRIESFRPLGMANAWLTYHLSGNIYLQQILNWLFAIAAFVLLFTAVKNRILFSLLSFITAACFFSGYIYLFHLHGVFYGPFQLYVAALAIMAYRYRSLSGKMLAALALATVVISLYHTFALLVFCAFLAGYLLQLTKKDSKAAFASLGIVLLLTIVFTKLILQTKEFKGVQALYDGFIVSYRMAEINKGLTLVAILLAALASLTIAKSTLNKIISAAITIVLAVAMVFLHLPVLILWVGICLVKVLTGRNMVMAGLIVSTAILPLGSASGSPTYVIFVLMLCTFVTASGESLVIPDYRFIRRLTTAAVFLLFGCLILLKTGMQVPLVAAIARPILAEQEKTKQLKAIIDWKLKNKSYAGLGLVLFDAGGLPVNSGNAVNRINRPVAGQDDIDTYVDFFSNNSVPNNTKPAAAYVTFGDKILPGKELIFSVSGPWNGKACVFR